MNLLFMRILSCLLIYACFISYLDFQQSKSTKGKLKFIKKSLSEKPN